MSDPATFEELIRQAWADHAARPEEVAALLAGAGALVEEPAQIEKLAQIVVHVHGEHLGRWGEGAGLLERLRSHPLAAGAPEPGRALRRGLASLAIAAGERADDVLEPFGSSDRIRILAAASSALAGQGRPSGAAALFEGALTLAEAGIDAGDPALRALAVTGNNLACALEEKPARSDEEGRLMLLAAEAGRRFWERAGTWREVERAEYRWAMSCLQARQFDEAASHARSCLAICAANDAEPLERFFGYEALARAEKARGDEVQAKEAVDRAREAFSRLAESARPWCVGAMEALEAL